MSWLRFHTVLSLVAGALACAPVAHQRDALLKRTPCCASFNQLAFSPLPADSAVELAVSRDSPVFRFPSGQNYFLAFSLPPDSSRTLSLQIRPQGNTSITENTYCPRLLLLDATFGILSDLDLALRLVIPGGLARLYYLGDAPVPPEASFLVIYSPRALVGDSVPVPRYEYLTRHFEPSSIPCGHTGRFRLRLTTSAKGAG